MPSYEYQCEHHGVFEAHQSIKDEPLQECPLCKKENKKSEPPKKLISLSSFVLAGSGWAKDNYK